LLLGGQLRQSAVPSAACHSVTNSDTTARVVQLVDLANQHNGENMCWIGVLIVVFEILIQKLLAFLLQSHFNPPSARALICVGSTPTRTTELAYQDGPSGFRIP
jgi:hypothetical protein